MDDDETSVDLRDEEPTPLAYSEAVEEPVRESWWSAGGRAVLGLANAARDLPVPL